VVLLLPQYSSCQLIYCRSATAQQKHSQ
jgi:phosphatidylglycerophosphate synthase